MGLAARLNAFLNNFGISADFSILRFEKCIRADGVCPPSAFPFEKNAWLGRLREIRAHSRAPEAVRSMLLAGKVIPDFYFFRMLCAGAAFAACGKSKKKGEADDHQTRFFQKRSLLMKKAC